MASNCLELCLFIVFACLKSPSWGLLIFYFDSDLIAIDKAVSRMTFDIDLMIPSSVAPQSP